MYTPIVVLAAVAIAVISPFLGFTVGKSVESALVFLVVSCPCALVISVPLSFFGGIGAASRRGILVKGSSYLEALSQVDTIAFDKTGTLTNSMFGVVAVHTRDGVDKDLLLSYAAHAEAYSDHPIALSVVKSYSGVIDRERIQGVEERGGQGVEARVDEHRVLIGNDKPSNIAGAIRIARKTLRIVRQNIAFALAVKIVIMVLALPTIGISSMWMAVFGDVGVSVLAILNAMRCLAMRK